MAKRPNFLIILIDDLRFDEFGAGGHPYLKTPHIDRIARDTASHRSPHDHLELRRLVVEAGGL